MEEKNKKQNITKDMLISEVLRKYPDSIDVFLKKGIGCAMCPMAQQETIEQGILGHGMNPDEFVKELNEFLEKNTRGTEKNKK